MFFSQILTSIFIYLIFNFFIAPETGLYKIVANECDAGAWFWLATDGAFDCCSQGINSDSADDILLGIRDDGNYGSYVYLEEGVLYPMRAVYINLAGAAIFQFEVVTPSGYPITDFSSYIVNFDVSELSDCGEVTASNPLSTTTAVTIGTIVDTEFNEGVIFVTSGTKQMISTYVVENLEFTEADYTFRTTITGTTSGIVTSTGLTTADTGIAAAIYVIDNELQSGSLATTTSVTGTTTTQKKYRYQYCYSLGKRLCICHQFCVFYHWFPRYNFQL